MTVKNTKIRVSVHTRLERVANDSLPREAFESPKIMLLLQEEVRLQNRQRWRLLPLQQTRQMQRIGIIG